MNQAGINLFTSSIELIPSSFSSIAPLSFPICLGLAIYILNLYERQKKASLRLKNDTETCLACQPSPELRFDRSQAELILKEVPNSFTSAPKSISDKKNYSSQKKLPYLPQDAVLVGNFARAFKDMSIAENIYQQLLRPFSSLRFFELGVLSLFALGGASFLLRERPLDLNSNIDQRILETLQVSNSVRVARKIDSIDRPIFDSEHLKDLVGKSLRISLNKKKAKLFDNNSFFKVNPMGKLTKQFALKDTKIDLVRRRLMFQLTPKEYAELIPTSLEIEWYGLGTI